MAMMYNTTETITPIVFENHNVYAYHRDVGLNSFFYTKQADVPLEKIKIKIEDYLYHGNDDELSKRRKHIYDNDVRPYLLYLVNAPHNVELIMYNGTNDNGLMEVFRQQSDDVIPIKNTINLSVFVGTTNFSTVNNVYFMVDQKYKDIIYDIIPDDYVLVQIKNTNTMVLMIQLLFADKYR
jgi:hypothetical protein